MTIRVNNVEIAGNHEYLTFVGATQTTDGKQGIVPKPLAGDQKKLLKADGTWVYYIPEEVNNQQANNNDIHFWSGSQLQYDEVGTYYNYEYGNEHGLKTTLTVVNSNPSVITTTNYDLLKLTPGTIVQVLTCCDTGRSWLDTRITPNSQHLSEDIAFGNGVFMVLVSHLEEGSYYTKCFVSADGETWTSHDLPYQTVSDYWCLSYENGGFTACNGSVFCRSTDNGVTWTGTNTLPNLNWEGITYFNEKYFVVSGGLVYSSADDGATWTSTSIGIQSFIGLDKNENVMVTVGYNSNVAKYTLDGVTWNTANLPRQLFWSSVMYDGSRFFATAFNSNYAAYSDDGVVWTEIQLPESQRWTCVIGTNTCGTLIMLSEYGAGHILQSKDHGLTWEQITIPPTHAANWSYGAYGNEIFVGMNGSQWVTRKHLIPLWKDENNNLVDIRTDNYKITLVGFPELEDTITCTWLTTDGIRHVYVRHDTPTLSDKVYYNIQTESELTITSISGNKITLSDRLEYTKNPVGNQVDVTAYDNDTIYNVANSTQDVVIPVFEIMFPVGATYSTTNSSCPIANYLGTWVLEAENVQVTEDLSVNIFRRTN